MRSIPLFLSLFIVSFVSAQVNPYSFNELRWRMIGPHRGGRTVGAVGVPTQPNVFYIGVNNGGVWKTTDFGRTWFPIFDDQPTGSIGDVAVSPSNPNVVYVGTGEGIQRPDLSVGNGMYRSADAGKTWSYLGLPDVQQVAGLSLDPTDENRLFVAALGHPYGANKERGVYRTLNGGKTWEQVLFIDENTGAAQVTIDPKNRDIIYADMWAGRQGPWENGAWEGPGSGLFKSTDGGKTWKKLIKGLPTIEQGLGRIGFAIAPTNSKRLYAAVQADQDAGIYRSDDEGETWTKMQSDNRLWGRGDDFAELKVDPTNEDIVYDANIVTWKSVDGGKTWNAFRGAPGGDDYHRLWINPTNPAIILIASDQGAIITVNGGQTFSSWYNQPTAQFYHVSTDNAFPYNVYGGQQESGSVGIASRSNDGEITFRDWHPVGAEEYAYVAPDPINPDIIYGGKISRYDKKTGQTQNISPEAIRSGKYRFLRTAPVLFSPVDKKTLYYAGNVLFKTMNGGNSWEIISPDLSRESWDIPASVGIYSNKDMKTMPRRGVIYTVAPSPKDINVIWCGTDDGLIHLTRDGGRKWNNVTPPSITPWSKISLMDASHFDVNTAYAAVNRIRLDDMHPHIYRTKDGGKTWKEIVKGLPDDPINVVREDPVRKGLLFAGSERAVYYSIDDGERWQSLRLNMPATSIRDLVIKDDDLVVGTHGRSFWILDDITPLRQINTDGFGNSPHLFKPATAYRVRWNMNTDTPLPQEEPAGENPPDGAILDYYIPKNVNGEVALEIADANGNLVRRYSSNDTFYKVPPVNIPLYWIRPQQILSPKEGAHRFVWDLHYTPVNTPPSFPIAAIYMNTAPSPTSPWVMPGTYTVKLIVNGKQYREPILVKMDPRVKTSIKYLQLQHDLSLQLYKGRLQVLEVLQQIRSLKSRVQDKIATVKGAIPHLNMMVENLSSLETTPQGKNDHSFSELNGTFVGLLSLLQQSDQPPTATVVKAVAVTLNNFQTLLNRWNHLDKNF